MSFINPTESLLSDPLSKETRKIRTTLIVTAGVGLALSFGVVRIDTVNAIGAKVFISNDMLSILIISILLYLLVTFLTYSSTDRLAYKAKNASSMLAEAAFLYNSCLDPKELMEEYKNKLAEEMESVKNLKISELENEEHILKSNIQKIENDIMSLSRKGEIGSRFTLYSADFKILKNQSSGLKERLDSLKHKYDSKDGETALLKESEKSSKIEMALNLLSSERKVTQSLEELSTSSIFRSSLKLREIIDLFFPIAISLSSMILLGYKVYSDTY